MVVFGGNVGSGVVPDPHSNDLGTAGRTPVSTKAPKARSHVLQYSEIEVEAYVSMENDPAVTWKDFAPLMYFTACFLKTSADHFAYFRLL